MRNILVVAICTVSLFLSSCQDWIDVNPKTDIEAEKFFTYLSFWTSDTTKRLLPMRITPWSAIWPPISA